MVQLVSEGSEETSETSTSSRVPHRALETWQRWHPGSYFLVLLVNATATACLFHRSFEIPTYEWDPVFDGSGVAYHILESAPSSLSYCPFSDMIAFSSLMLASFGAGCVAAFLQKRANASSHARSACGYATINWFQSLFGSLTCLMLRPDEGDDGSYFRCKYGFLPAEELLHVALNVCRLALYLIGLFWVQTLLAKRTTILEKKSRQKYCSRCLRMFIWLQALGVAVVVLSFSVIFFHFYPNDTYDAGDCSYYCKSQIVHSEDSGGSLAVDLVLQHGSKHSRHLLPHPMLARFAESVTPCRFPSRIR